MEKTQEDIIRKYREAEEAEAETEETQDTQEEEKVPEAVAETREKITQFQRKAQEGEVHCSAGLKPKKTEIYLDDVYGKTYKINAGYQTMTAVATIGKAMQRVKDDDTDSFVQMLYDALVIIFGKESAEEIINIACEKPAAEAIDDMRALLETSVLLMQGKTPADAAKEAAADSVRKEAERFQKTEE